MRPSIPTLAASLVLAIAGASRAESPRADRAPAESMAAVGPGELTLFYPPTPDEKTAHVARFLLDRRPVTNREFLEFVRAAPKWRRDRIARLFADERYLSSWKGPDELGPDLAEDAPVVFVSWFAANAYCEARGARLPTENEWELAAAASETSADGHDDPNLRERLLAWYARPSPSRLPTVGRSRPNYWGVQDLHGLVWEWVLDFNSSLVTGDSRDGGDPNKLSFCGAGSLASSDVSDYAGFMRLAFRSSLQARYTVANLGFRCAADAEKER